MQQLDITKLTIEQLKAIKSDLHDQLEQASQGMALVRQELAKRQAAEQEVKDAARKAECLEA